MKIDKFNLQLFINLRDGHYKMTYSPDKKSELLEFLRKTVLRTQSGLLKPTLHEYKGNVEDLLEERQRVFVSETLSVVFIPYKENWVTPRETSIEGPVVLTEVFSGGAIRHHRYNNESIARFASMASPAKTFALYKDENFDEILVDIWEEKPKPPMTVGEGAYKILHEVFKNHRR